MFIYCSLFIRSVVVVVVVVSVFGAGTSEFLFIYISQRLVLHLD